MKFGKLEDFSAVDFSIPEWTPDTLGVLGGQKANQVGAYVGLSRWASKDWVGDLYPNRTKAADYLSWYAKTFNSIEFNSTHYRTPTADQVKKWAGAVGSGFRFCPKVPQVISHYRKLVGVEEEVTRFATSILHFEEKLGPSFLQLHESYGPAGMDNLAKFAAQWPREVPLAIEFRHPDWFVHQTLLPAAADILEKAGIGTVITDVAGRRDVLHTSLTTRFAMVRFVGNALHPSDYTRTDDWMTRYQTAVDQGLEDIYVFPHEGGDPAAAIMGREYLTRLRAAFQPEYAGEASGTASEGNQLALF